MRDLELKTLRLFADVCEHGNMARAAEQAHIETSAISKRIAQLERDLDTPLLIRGARGVQPTAAGHALLEHVRGVLFSVDRMVGDVEAYRAGTRAHVRLVASASAIAESLLEDVAGFLRDPQNQAIQVDVDERPSSDLVRQLRDRSASLGVCWDNADLTGLEHRPYRRDDLGIAVHPDHPLARRRSLRFDETLDHEHVGMPPTTAVHAMLGRAAARIGRTVRYRAIVSNFDAAFRVVAANLGISVVPMQVGRAYAKLHRIRVVALTDDWAARRFVVASASFDGLQPAARRVVEHLVAAAAAAEAKPRRATGRSKTR